MKNRINIKNFIVKIVAFLVFVVLAVTPLIMMYKLSQNEMEDYVQDKQYNYRETAYGEISMVCRKDIEQYYMVDGQFESSTYKKMTFEADKAHNIEIIVAENDEVYKNQTIANIDGKKIVSQCNGVICEINEMEGFVKVLSYDEPELNCYVEKKIADALKANDSLKLEDGRKVTVKSVSNTMVDNRILVVLRIENCDYMNGETVEDLKLFTGRVFKDILAVDKRTVYKKNDGNYYVRTVDEAGYFIAEIQVNVNYESDDEIGITGVEEGTYCDAGYSNYVENLSVDMEGEY